MNRRGAMKTLKAQILPIIISIVSISLISSFLTEPACTAATQATVVHVGSELKFPHSLRKIRMAKYQASRLISSKQ